MFNSKILALSLLLVSPLALARVHLNMTMEMNNPFQTKTITTEADLDANVSIVVYESDDIRIEAELVSEDADRTTVKYTVSAKTAEGLAQLISAPELSLAYGQVGSLTFENKSLQTEKAALTITAQAKKA